MFDYVAIMGKKGDQTSNPTLRWDDEDNRPTTPLGKVSIMAIAPQQTCDAGVFLPGNVTNGIAGPSDSLHLHGAVAGLYRLLHATEADAVIVIGGSSRIPYCHFQRP